MSKTDQFLLIENAGEAPVEGYTVLGYSSTRNCGNDGVIGQFGSGSKHAINLCLRQGIPVWVYCGNTRLEFGLEKSTVDDGITESEVYHVVCRKNNASWSRVGWVLDFGALDWCDIGMGLREFVSNAIDRSIREDGGLDSNHISVKIVDDSDRRAKAGKTRVYVGVNDDVREYFGQLGKKFLHFSDNPGNARPQILRKSNSNEGASIYREGVYVRTIGVSSLFDYNFSADEIKIDECRNSSDYDVRAAVARKVGNASPTVLATIFEAAMAGDEKCLEANLDDYHMFGTWGAAPNETQESNWKTAWELTAGSAVLCENRHSVEYAERKGYKGRVVPTSIGKAIKRISGVKNVEQVLTEDELAGRTPRPATAAAITAVDWAWDVLDLAGLLNNKTKPEVFCFQESMKAESLVCGFCNSTGVHFNVEMSDAVTAHLKKVALEELAHWITGATDNSRDFQDFLLSAVVALA